MLRRVFLLIAASGLALAPGRGALAFDFDAVALHDEAIVVDGHNDVAMWIVDHGFDLGFDGRAEGTRSPWPWLFASWLPGRPSGRGLATDTDLARMRVGGLDAQFFSVWVAPEYYDPETPGKATARALEIFDALRGQAARHADDLEIATRVADVRRIAAEGRIAMLFGVEGGHAIEGDLATLHRFRQLGARYMTLTWSFSHDWADSSGDEGRHGGLTDFGREVVLEMNRIGMLVDVSHVSDDTFWDVIEVTRAPVIASHSSARALAPHPRNLSDEMLRAVAENGGVVMVNFGGIFLDPRKVGRWNLVRNAVAGGLSVPPTTLDMLIGHIEHVARVAGHDHVGLGSDFDGTLFLPEGLSDVSDLPNLTEALVARGWSEEDVKKLLGENVLRVMAAAEALASPVETAGAGAR